MRQQLKHTASGEEGFVLALSLVVMAVLIIIGAAGMNTAMFELDIAGNDSRQREAFYRSDAGVDIASEVLEQELACKGELATGFPLESGGSGAFVGEDGIYVMDTTSPLWMQEAGHNQVPDEAGPVDIVFPHGRNDDGSVTMMTVNGQTAPLWGGALQMGAGYMGKGRGAASGGAEKNYYIYSKHLAATRTNISSTVLVQWRHVVGDGGGCVYGSSYSSTYEPEDGASAL